MAKTITFTDLATPTGLTCSLVSGGTLLSSTVYYYKVVAVFSSGLDQASSFAGKSLSSDETSIITDVNNKSVQLTWSHPKGIAGSYKIYRSTTPGGQISCINTLVSDSVANVGGTCSFIDTGYALSGNNCFQNTSHGKLTLSSSSPSTDIWSIVDLYNADVANGWGVVTRLDNSTYKVDAYIIGYVSQLWVDEEKTIIINDAWNAASSSIYRFGRKTGSITNRGCHIIFKTYFLFTTTFSTLNAYKTTFDWIADYNVNFTTYSGLSFFNISTSICEIIDCQSNKLRSFQPSSVTNCIITNFILTEYDTGLGLGAATLTNVTGMGGSRPFQTSTGTVMKAKNFTSVSNTYTLLLNGQNAQITMVNTNAPVTSYVANIDSSNSFVEEKFTYNLTVIDNNTKLPINTANVKIYDVLNNLLCDINTNASGIIEEQELIFRRSTFVALVRTTTSHTPHKIVVIKSGYETYIGYNEYAGANATSHIISLKPDKKIRNTLEGKLFIAANPESGSDSYLIQI